MPTATQKKRLDKIEWQLNPEKRVVHIIVCYFSPPEPSPFKAICKKEISRTADDKAGLAR